jgi:hypothetical protein
VWAPSGAAELSDLRPVDRREQLFVHPGRRVEPAAPIRPVTPVVVGEATSGLSDQQDPRGVIPNLAAVDVESVDVTTDYIDQRQSRPDDGRLVRWKPSHNGRRVVRDDRRPRTPI